MLEGKYLTLLYVDEAVVEVAVESREDNIMYVRW